MFLSGWKRLSTERCVIILADIVRQAQVVKSIISMLRKEFGCKVYSDEVREHFEKPCFFIAASSVMTPYSVNWMRKELTIRLTYYAEDSGKNEISYMDITDRVQLLFQVDLQVNDRNLKIDRLEDDRVGEEDDILQLTITIPYLERVKKAASTAEMMEEVEFNVHQNAGRPDQEDFPGHVDKDTV